jgi:copper chaperone NosL
MSLNRLAVFAMILMAPVAAFASVVDLPDGSKLDLESICPVCAMKVETTAIGPAAIVFNDGKVVGFDGAGEMFRYKFDPGQYKFDPKQIKEIYVTEYGTDKFMPAKDALYVVGTDLQQGMGPELAPFAKKEDAEKFRAEHKGTAVATFSQVSADDVKAKKKMLKMQH